MTPRTDSFALLLYFYFAGVSLEQWHNSESAVFQFLYQFVQR